MTTTAGWNIALIGECMIEIQGTFAGGYTLTFGGDTLNTAVYLARLGREFGVRVEYVTALGDDRYSAAMLDFWKKEDVRASLVRRLPGRLPGLYFIDLGPDGERSFSYWRGEAAARDCFEGPGSQPVLDALGGFDAVYLSGVSLGILREDGRGRLLRRLGELHDKGTAIFFDFNFRPRLWASGEGEAFGTARPWYEQMLSLCRVALLTADEAPAAGCRPGEGDLCERLAGFGPEEIIVKNGAKDCLAWHKGVVSAVRSRAGARVVDTTAAGDSFSAAYLLGRHLGLSVPEAVARAHELAAAVIAHRGAVIPREAMPRLFPGPGFPVAAACE